MERGGREKRRAEIDIRRTHANEGGKRRETEKGGTPGGDVSFSFGHYIMSPSPDIFISWYCCFVFRFSFDARSGGGDAGRRWSDKRKGVGFGDRAHFHVR